MSLNQIKYLLLLFFFLPINCFADARKNYFRNSNNSSQYFSLGASYGNDPNSEEYKVAGNYKYSNNRFINELELLYDTRYSSATSGASKTNLIKNKDLYDGEFSSKILISNSSNYFNYYNRSKYDSYSDYYYDLTNEVGWGRMFFGGILEADINVGYNEIKNFDSQVVFNPNLKANFLLTDKIRLTTKAYIFKIKDTYYQQVRSRISYKLNKDISLELSHNYDKKAFLYKTTKIQTVKTEISKDLIFRIRYDF